MGKKIISSNILPAKAHPAQNRAGFFRFECRLRREASGLDF